MLFMYWQALSAAAIDDVTAWCTLAITLSYSSTGNRLERFYAMLIAVGYVLFMGFAVHPVLKYIYHKLIARDQDLAELLYGYLPAAVSFLRLSAPNPFLAPLQLGWSCHGRGGSSLKWPLRLSS